MGLSDIASSLVDEFDDTLDDDDEDSTIPCPYCRREIHEDSPRCPYCENYISAEDSHPATFAKPWWVIVGAILGLFAVYRWLFG